MSGDGPMPLLVYAPTVYDVPSFMVIDHPIFKDVEGHFQSLDFEAFYTDDIHHEVVEFLSVNEQSFEKEGTEVVRGVMGDDDIEHTKHITLMEFFVSQSVGSREPVNGEKYRGTIIMASLF